MASIAQLVSEIAHSVGDPNNAVLRENIKSLIIHTRNEVIRRSYENHGYVDRGLEQRFRVSLIDVSDGDITNPYIVPSKVEVNDKGEIVESKHIKIEVNRDNTIKRTKHKVPTPVRVPNNLPFNSISSTGYKNNKVFPYIKEQNARFRNAVPGLSGTPSYDYINGYIYLFPSDNKYINIDTITINSVFEFPTEIQLANHEVDSMDVLMDENEYLLSEDMIGQIKEIMYARDLLNNKRLTDEVL